MNLQKQQIKERLERLNKTQRYLSRIFKRKPQQITQALEGSQPTLLNKIIRHLDKLESKQDRVAS